MRTRADVFSAAYGEGVEISFRELADVLGYEVDDPLGATQRLLDYSTEMGLAFSPDSGEGDFDSARVLRSPNSGTSTIERELEVAIEAGESTSVEYKASLYANLDRLQATGELHAADAVTNGVLKTICAFLNTRGGTLLIGISDDGSSCPGINHDLKCKGLDMDGLLLALVALIRDRFYEGALAISYVSVDRTTMDGCDVFCVRVIQRGQPTFVKLVGEHVYSVFVRNGPRSDSLTFPEFSAWLQAKGSLTSPGGG